MENLSANQLQGAGYLTASDGLDLDSPRDPAPDRLEVDHTSRFRLEPLSRITLDTSCSMLIKGVMPARGLLVIYGAPSTGKSFVALDAAMHVAAGRSWADRKVKPGGVVYVAAEGGFGFRKRVLAATEHHGFDKSAPFALVTAAPTLGGPDGDAGSLISDIEKQSAWFSAKPSVVIIDTLARSITGSDESNAGQMSQFIGNIEAIGAKLQALMIIVHHSGKDPAAGMRGSSALNAAADCVWRIEKNEAGDRSIIVEKMKDHEDGIALPFHLVTRHCGTDDEGDAITSCVVAIGRKPDTDSPEGSQDAEPQARPLKLPQHMRLLTLLTSLIEQKGKLVPASADIPDGIKALSQTKLDLLVPEMESESSSDRSRRVILMRALGRLEAEGFLGRNRSWVWVKQLRSQS